MKAALSTSCVMMLLRVRTPHLLLTRWLLVFLCVINLSAGGAWDNAKKWCEKCAEEGEPISTSKGGELEQQMTFTNFGIKKARHFPELYREHGLEAFVKDPQAMAAYNSPDGLARLQGELAELYHKRRE